MELSGYLRAVRRRWWLVALTTLLGLGAATVMTMVTKPQYATSMTFYVTTPNRGISDAYEGSMLSQQRVKSYADLLTGDRLAKMINDRYPFGLSVEQIQSRISAQSVPNTALLRATTVDSDPVRSARLGDALAMQFV